LKLHLNKVLFSEAIQFTSQEINLKPEYIEKDYWVTLALYTIFNHEIGNDMVFKGGTALSKCYQFIQRFSEDIDLVVLRREGESSTMLSKKIKQISSLVNAVIPEIDVDGITRKKGLNRKTAHSYSKEFHGSYGQARDYVVLEATCLGYHEPYSQKSIISILGEIMINRGQEPIAEEYALLPFKLNVLDATRTFCEKIMSLVRFSYSKDPLTDLKNKIRHTYDLHQLLQQEELIIFFQSQLFDEMLLRVAHDDQISFKNNNDWLVNHPCEALLFKDLDTIWKDLKLVYSGNFSELVFGELPNEAEVLKTLLTIKTRLAQIDWEIKIN